MLDADRAACKWKYSFLQLATFNQETDFDSDVVASGS